MARNASGTHSLPAGNPVASGTTISSTWANDTMDDFSSEITNSLDRNGKGGMLAALRGIDGVIGGPAYSWTSETNSGMYRAAAGDVRISVLGVDIVRFLSGTGLQLWSGSQWDTVEITTGGLDNVVEDTTPQLGGNLDVNGKSIVSASGGDIAITPDTSGDIILDGQKWPQADGTANYVLTTDGAGQLSWTNTLTMSSVSVTTLDANGGSIDGATIGGSSAGAGTFTALVATTFSIDTISEKTAANGVTIDGLLIKDAGIPEAAVTAHEAALTILESQITADYSTYEAADAAIVKSDEAETISSTWTFSGATTFSGSITLNGEVVEQDAAHSQSAGTLTLDPTNGLIQRITLTQNVTTVTDNLADGEYISLHILDGASTYTITWPTAWKWAGGSTPTLDATDMNVIEVWRANSQTYAALVGVMSSA